MPLLSFGQEKWWINEKNVKPIIFDPNVRILDSDIFKLDKNYNMYFDRFNPNAKPYMPDSELIRIMKKYEVKFVPILNSENLRLLSDRINSKVTTCSDGFTSLINQFTICRIDATNCCDTTFINKVTKELEDLKTKSIEIYSIHSIKTEPTLYPLRLQTSPCTDYRYIMNLGFLFRQAGGLGDNSNLTLVENELIDSTHSFGCSSNPWISNASIFKRFFSTFSTNPHPLINLSILFDNIPSCEYIGVSPNAKINKVILADGNCGYSKDVRFNALLSGILETPEYGVLLIEFGGTSNQDFAEVVKINYDLIKLATECLNIIVIEPAGNQGTKVETRGFEYKNPPTLSEMWNPETYDSGAIMVSGAKTERYLISGGKTYRRPLWNFGNRVDCYSLCENICTNEGKHGGTSAASAIIAGMAVDIQSICKTRYGRFLCPTEMRNLFRKPSNRLVIHESCSDCVTKYIPTGDKLLVELDNLFLPYPPNCPLER